MEIKQLDPKDKVITFFDNISSSSVGSAIKDIAKINMQDREFERLCKQWARDNNMSETAVTLSPISFYLSTNGGSCYDGLALYDTINASHTLVEIICSGKIMSMGIVVTLAAKVRKAYRNTTFMIHPSSGMAIGQLREMEDGVEEVRRMNEMIFGIIRERTKITEQQLKEVVDYKRDWYMTASEALDLGLITEII